MSSIRSSGGVDLRRGLGQRGQTLVLFVVLLPGLIALMALGIDAGYVFIQHRVAQSAADLAALAGARLLPTDATGARTRAANIAGANGFTSGVTVTTPYNGNTSQVEVQIATDVQPFFMTALGVGSVDVAVRAVGRVSSTPAARYAIFAGQV